MRSSPSQLHVVFRFFSLTCPCSNGHTAPSRSRSTPQHQSALAWTRRTRTLYKSLTMPFAVGERRFDHRTRIVVLFRQMLHGAGSQGIDARLWRIVRSTTFLCAQSGELRTDLPCPKSSFLVRSGGLRASLLLRSTVEGAIGARSSQTRCWRGESRRRDGGGVPVAH